ncbi:unnamed protein product [Chrysoparadoxa australica]
MEEALFIEITGAGPLEAQQYLQASGGLDQAVNSYFERGERVESAILVPDSSIREDAKKRQLSSPSAAAAKKKKPGTCENSKVLQSLGPSTQWLEAVTSAREQPKGLWVDEAFPPNASSLDGIKDAAEPGEEEVQCLCGKAAQLKRVSKAGPNQNKLFYACANRWDGCKFFRWSGGAGQLKAAHSARVEQVEWRSFGSTPHSPFKVVRGGKFAAEDVQQGAIGNCWFCAALAVVAEKPERIAPLMRTLETNVAGVYEVRLFVNGSWQDVLVDSFLPCMSQETAKKGKRWSQHGLAYSRATGNQLWPCLMEKAYAKVLGSYQALSGGHVTEALLALTGAPSETLVMSSQTFDSEDGWVKLASWSSAGFPMGAATPFADPALKQGGLVGLHAYSVLEAIEVKGVAGRQPTLEESFRGTNRMRRGSSEVLRLVKVRNPWGAKGTKNLDFCAKSVTWTPTLRRLLQPKSNDGTSWMRWEDFFTRFDVVDVAKAHDSSWKHASFSNSTMPSKDSFSCRDSLEARAEKRTWCYISVIQPTKRGCSNDNYWYKSISLYVSVKLGSSNRLCAHKLGWALQRAPLVLELWFEAGTEYCIDFGCLDSSQHVNPFMVCLYSSKDLGVTRVDPSEHRARALLHQACHLTISTTSSPSSALKFYPVAERAALAVLEYSGVILFVVLSARSADAPPLMFQLRINRKEQIHAAGGDIAQLVVRGGRQYVVKALTAMSYAYAYSFKYSVEPVASSEIKMTKSGLVDTALERGMAELVEVAILDARVRGQAEWESGRWKGTGGGTAANEGDIGRSAP